MASPEAQLTLTVSTGIDHKDLTIKDLLARLTRWQQLFASGAEPYTLTGYEDLYITQGDRLLVYDTFAKPSSRFLGFDTYRDTWEAQINQNFPGFIMDRVHVDRVEYAGALAWSALTWYGTILGPDGTRAESSQHGTHIWYRGNGGWAIVHEHLSGPATGAAATRPPSDGRDVSHILMHARR